MSVLYKKKSKAERPKKCVLCGEIFSCGQALGGHMSRAHPG